MVRKQGVQLPRGMQSAIAEEIQTSRAYVSQMAHGLSRLSDYRRKLLAKRYPEIHFDQWMSMTTADCLRLLSRLLLGSRKERGNGNGSATKKPDPN